MATTRPDITRQPLEQAPSGTRSRGNSSAAANKFHPDHYLNPNVPQGMGMPPQAAGGTSFSNSAPITPQGGGPPNLSQGGTPTYPITPQPYAHPSHLAQQYIPTSSSPMPIQNSNQQYMRPPPNAAAPPYPMDDPWGPNMGPSSAPNSYLGAMGTSAPTGSSGGYFPVPGQKYINPRHGHDRRGSESSMKPRYDNYYGNSNNSYNYSGNGNSNSSSYTPRPRRSSTPGHRKSSDYDDDDKEYRRKHHHHHHHSNDTEHRPTVGDTMVSMFGVVKDYLGPVHRD